jgi:hypothetical protein
MLYENLRSMSKTGLANQCVTAQAILAHSFDWRKFETQEGSDLCWAWMVMRTGLDDADHPDDPLEIQVSDPARWSAGDWPAASNAALPRAKDHYALGKGSVCPGQGIIMPWAKDHYALGKSWFHRVKLYRLAVRSTRKSSTKAKTPGFLCAFVSWWQDAPVGFPSVRVTSFDEGAFQISGTANPPAGLVNATEPLFIRKPCQSISCPRKTCGRVGNSPKN